MTDKHVKNMFAKMIEPDKQIERVMLDSTTKLTVDSETSLYIGQDWIPCDVQLPAVHEPEAFLSRQGIRAISDLCIVTLYDGQNYIVDTNCRLRDGEWASEKISLLTAINKKCEVLAWMPWPEPYRPKINHSIQ